MTAKFYPKPAHFESKSQVAPNSLVFHRGLTDEAKILILALNGISTNAPKWTIVQCDIQSRLGWGLKKMQSAIKSAVNCGYLIVTQGHHEESSDSFKKGQFKPNEFEFDIDGGYIKKEYIYSQEKRPHNESEPMRRQALTPRAMTPREALPCSSRDIPSEKKKETQDFLSSLNFEDQRKMRFLSDFNLEDSYLSVLLQYDYDRIVLGARGALQWKKRREDSGGSVDDLGGAFVKFVTQGWKPYKTQEDIEDEKSQLNAEKESQIMERHREAKTLEGQWANILPFKYSFKVHERNITVSLNGKYPTIELSDPDSIQILKDHINLYKDFK